MLDKNLIFVGKKFKNSTDVLRFLGQKMYEAGYVVEGYAQAAINREKEYPTGLPGEDYGIAIPHSDPEYIIKPGVAIAVLEEPVVFELMGSEGEKLECLIVMMLAVAEENGHIETLQKLSDVIMDGSVMNKIIKERDPEKIMDLLRCLDEE